MKTERQKQTEADRETERLAPREDQSNQSDWNQESAVGREPNLPSPISHHLIRMEAETKKKKTRFT